MLTKFAVVTLLIAFSQTIDGKGTVTGKTSKPNKFFKCPTGKSAVGSLLSGIASSLRSKKDLPDICYNVVVNEFTARIGKQGTDDDVRVRLCSDVESQPILWTMQELQTEGEEGSLCFPGQEQSG